MIANTNSKSPPKGKKPTRVGIILARNFTLSAFSLFVDTLRLASDQLDRSGRRHLDWEVVSDTSQLIKSSCGIFVAPTARLNPREFFDYIVVVGGRLNVEQQLSEDSTTYLKQCAERRVPIVALCTGSFILAQAGLLSAKTACVSWLHREEFQQQFPDIELVSHMLFVEDGLITTCAGGTAVADLAAHIVKKHVGIPAAKNAMEILQIDRHRKGSDIQARIPLQIPAPQDHRVKLSLVRMEEDISKKCNIKNLAERVGLSTRQLERLFKKEFRTAPKVMFDRIRFEKAKFLVENSQHSIVRIAIELGYESQSHFSHRFRGHFGVTPAEARCRCQV